MAAPAPPRALTAACNLAACVVLALVCVAAAIAPPRAVDAPVGPPGVQSGDPPEPRVIDITARRFAFEPSVVEIAVGEPVRLRVRSGDGLHGIAIEKLEIAREIPRGGEAVIIDIVASEPGRFPIACSEYCGSGHDDMTGMLVVHAGEAAEPARTSGEAGPEEQ